MPQSPIKVFLVEDSPVALEVLQKLLKSSPRVTVVGTARNGKEALDLIPKVQPNVICTDLHMAGMDGLELTQQVMAKYPLPILVISNSVQADDTNNIFKVLQAGALDVLPKPTTGRESDYEQVKAQLISKIEVLSGVSVFTKPLKQPTAIETGKSASIAKSFRGRATVEGQSNATSSIRIVAIGASTGGPQALLKILASLPSNFPVPIVCNQHISEGFLPGLVDWLASESQLKFKIARAGESPSAGTVYFAPDRSHLELDSQGKFTYSNFKAVDGHCPSITVLFKSVAQFYGKGTMGILLTGMGKDGAQGMQEIAQAGGMTIAQDEASSIVFGMPKEAIALGAVQHILPIQNIATFVLNRVFSQ
jgi:two-component system, chemotaxis family, protein-glutamate methylesterase/glutaminase